MISRGLLKRICLKHMAQSHLKCEIVAVLSSSKFSTAPQTNPKPDESSCKVESSATKPTEADRLNDAKESEETDASSSDKQTSDLTEKRKKPLLSRFFSGIKDKIDHEMYAPIPAQYKHSMIKGYVINQIDPATLVYPEFDETSHVVEAEGFAQHVERQMEKSDSKVWDANKHMPADFVDECKKLGLFGMQISRDYGGLGLNNKSTVRCYEELSRDWSLFSILYSHNHLVANAIEMYGTDAQKAYFLPRLADGRSTGAFCLHEPGCGQDTAAMETVASRTEPNGPKILLNGMKSWVTNGVNADVLIVFAKLIDQFEREFTPSTAFLIDRTKVQGVSDVERKDTAGLRAVNISGINFDRVQIDESSILGVEETGFDMATKIMNSSRYLFLAAAAACLKRALHDVTKYCNSTKRWGAMLSDSNAVRKRISRVSCDIYALESAAYYIAGCLDDDPKRDFLVENAALAKYARRILHENLLSLTEIIGAEGRTTSWPFELLLRDAITLSGFMASDDVISGYVAMESFKVFAAEFRTVIYRTKDVVHYPWQSIKDKFRRQSLYKDTVKIQHFINEHVHPSLERSCDMIESTIAKFEYIFKSAVCSTGKEVEEEHIVLDRITDVLTNLLVMITTMSRASRSYCIGLKNADHEMIMADAICIELRNKTMHLLAEMIEIDEPNTVDIRRKEIGDLILRNRGYTPETPIMRNW